MRRYDTTFIIDGNLGDSERLALIEKYAGTLKRLGGDIEQIVRWGLRTLAYTINKRSHGYYVIFYYRANPSIITAFERELRLNKYPPLHVAFVGAKTSRIYQDEGAPRRDVIPETPVSDDEADVETDGIEVMMPGMIPSR